MALTTIDDRGLKTPIDLLDNEKIRFGTGNDLELYHDGSDTYIVDSNSASDLFINSNKDLTLKIGDGAGGYHTALYADNDGAVRLYHNNVKKFETTSGGAVVQGQIGVVGNGVSLSIADGGKAAFGNGDDLFINHNGTDSNIINATGDLYIQNTGDDINIRAQDDINLQVQNGEAGINIIGDGAVELYYDNSKKFETYSSGVEVIGNLWLRTASGKIQLNDDIKLIGGNGDDLQIYHSSSDNNSYIQHTQNGTSLIVKSDYFVVAENQSTDIVMRAYAGTAELYYNNSKKFETYASGVKVAGKLFSSQTSGNAAMGMGDNVRIDFGDGDDLKIYHDGSDSYIRDAGTGSLYIDSNQLKVNNAASNETMAIFNENGSVDLYYDNSKKFETLSGGAKVTGNLLITGSTAMDDNVRSKWGTGDDLQIYHDGSNSYIEDSGTGSLILRTGRVSFNDTGNNEMGRFDGEGLKFNGDSAAANALDDYEEGTWTVADAAGAVSLTIESGARYTKIGRLVHIEVDVTVASNSSGTQAKFTLPFTATDYSGGVVNYTDYNDTLVIHVGSGAFVFKGEDANAGFSWSELSNKRVIFGLSYTAA